MSDKDSKPLMPAPKRERKLAVYHAGGKRSIAVLRSLKYDPITSLVDQYKRIEAELKYYEDWRSGKLIPLDSKGNERRYSWEPHMKCFEMLVNIGDKLLRYGYGRVPETIEIENRRPQPLVVNLTESNKVWTVNADRGKEPENYIDVDEDGNPIEEE